MRYHIKEGNHYKSNIGLKLHSGLTGINFSFIFDSSCWYKKINKDSLDINKLFGLSYGPHHKNSIRLGWVPDFENIGKIQLWSYVYNKGKRTFNHICDCNISDNYLVSFKVENNQLTIFIVGNEFCSIFKENFEIPKFKIGYFLYPYFGGDNPAPHDIAIDINLI